VAVRNLGDVVLDLPTAGDFERLVLEVEDPSEFAAAVERARRG
jgi:hypothetical protein